MKTKTDYFSSDALRQDLKGKTARGGLITVGSQGLKIAIGLASVPVLAWLLDPEDFGLIAMVAVFTNFARMFVDAGMSMATIQREDITRQQASNLFWIVTALGCLIASATAAASPIISWFYTEPRLTAVTLALAFSFVLAGLTVQPQALLRRGMQFRALALADVTSQLLSLLVAVAWAWRFEGRPYDYWALVLLPLVRAVVRLAMTWAACHWRPSLPRRGAGTRSLVGFGANLTGANFINYFSRNADNLLVGWWWGPELLGFYSQAYKLLVWPLQQVVAPMSSVMIPALSRLWEDGDRYRRHFRAGASLSSAVLVPAVFGLYILIEPLVIALLGNQWRGCISIFQALSPAAMVATTAPATHWVWVSSGRPDGVLRTTAVVTPILLTAFALATPFGPEAVAWSYSLVSVATRVPIIRYCFRGTPLSLSDQFDPMRPALWAALIAAFAGCLAMLAVLTTWDEVYRPRWELAAGGAVFAVVYAAAWLGLSGGRAELKRLFNALRKRPAPPS